MGFWGSYLQLDNSCNLFKIVETEVVATLDRAKDGTYLVILTINDVILCVLQHQTLLLHPKTQTFLWTSMTNPNGFADEFDTTNPSVAVEMNERTCNCFRFRSAVEYGIFERTTKALQRLHKCSMVHQSILMELKLQKIDDIPRLLAGKIDDTRAPVYFGENGTKATVGPVRTGLPVLDINQQGMPWKINTSTVSQAQARKSNSIFISRVENICHCCSKVSNPVMICPMKKPDHALCQSCLHERLGIDLHAMMTGLLTWNCPVCIKICPCSKCTGISIPVKQYQAQLQAYRGLLPTFIRSCVLCSRQEADGTTPGTKRVRLYAHAFVYQNGKGQPLFCCSACQKEIITRRLHQSKTNMIMPGEKSEEVCAICADGGSKRIVKLYCCSASDCTRAYCKICLDKVLTPEQLIAAEESSSWKCPNCIIVPSEPIEVVAASASEASEEVEVELQVEKQESPKKRTKAIVKKTPPKTKTKVKSPAKASPTKKQVPKRTKPSTTCTKNAKTRAKPPRKTPPATEDAGLPPVNAKMDEVEYIAKYIRFLVNREVSFDLNESEDVCFCCKDGGNVIECDWKIDKRRCPKIYHTDCLGFKIADDDKDWVCPRHFCADCGVKEVAFCCRFCPLSYCVKHLPADASKPIGSTLNDMYPAKYIVCRKCCSLQEQAFRRRRFTKTYGLSKDTQASQRRIKMEAMASKKEKGTKVKVLNDTPKKQAVKTHTKSKSSSKASSEQTRKANTTKKRGAVEIEKPQPSSSRTRKSPLLVTRQSIRTATKRSLVEEAEVSGNQRTSPARKSSRTSRRLAML